MPYARKQRMAPSQSSSENPPNRFWQNLTHSGVWGGGVSLLGPSLSWRVDIDNVLIYLAGHIYNIYWWVDVVCIGQSHQRSGYYALM